MNVPFWLVQASIATLLVMSGRDCTTPHRDGDSVEGLTNALEQDLLSRYGPLVGPDDLRQALGYSTMDAFRQACIRGKIPIPIFSLPNRRGKYALVKDLAGWLATLRQEALRSAPSAGKKQQ